ncbi:MAG: PIG-L family deacetylase [Bacteroidota bacterium]|nr:PIG-L family deacetylase [Bacteroidota bacterium]
MKKYLLLIFFLFTISFAQPRQMDAVELQLAINRLSVTGSVLYIAAHPDDENTALLSYFAKGKLLRTGYLSITRGEGGQNLIGSEQGTELGIIRTQELLAARKTDGAEQFFTRAIDFGYSKSSEEALRLWNKDSVLKDVVWVIRKFRPDIIITRFLPMQGGHGHHLASAILAEEAFNISGDSTVFPEQLKFVQPWKAKRLLYNQSRFSGTQPNSSNVQRIKIDVGEYSPLLGKSFTEIAGISRTMHKSQAMGSPQNKGTNVNEFVTTAGEPAKNDLFDGIETSWRRIPNGKKLAQMAGDIQKKFIPTSPEKSIPALLHFYKELKKINNDALIDRKMDEIKSVIQSCAGLWIEANANSPLYSHNDSLKISLTFLNRSSAKVTVASAFSPELNFNKDSKQLLNYNEPYQLQFSSAIRADEMYSQPYWLTSAPKNNRYVVADQSIVGKAENPAIVYVAVSVTIENEPMLFNVPVQYKWIDDLAGEKRRNVEIVPPVSIFIEEKNIIWSDASAKKVVVHLHSSRDNVNGMVSLRSSPGWNVSPAKSFSMMKKESETEIEFTVNPDSLAGSGELTAEAVVDGETFHSTVKHILHDHIPPQPLLVNATSRVLKFNLQKKGTSIGYITGAGDEVPKALEQMGYRVSFITDAELLSGNLMRYDAIVAGIRAYNTREQLRISNNSLLKYVERGGTYIVQYQTAVKGETDNIAPYKMELSRERVTDENAEMSCVKPDHPLLNYPNIISAKDFDGWVQERGLYFASAWDDKFEKVFSCADPNEKSLQGSLLIAKYGKGNYIFTGLAFFRQLPAGVEGAYRLFANLLSAGK